MRGVIDRIENDTAVVLIESNTTVQKTIPLNKIPETAHYENADLEVKFKDGNAVQISHNVSEEKVRMKEANKKRDSAGS